MRIHLLRAPWLAVTLLLTSWPLASLSTQDTQRLLDRAGLGFSASEHGVLGPLDRIQAVDRLIAQAKVADPPWAFPWKSELSSRQADDAEKKRDRENFQEWTSAWSTKIVTDPDALGERLVLFWHNHFTSSHDKVKSAAALVLQDETIRRNAWGNFRTFLREITLDPAMLIYLDAKDNQRNKPNENYARELFELFTLGEGQYTEADIKDAARALCGLSVDKKTGLARIVPKDADTGTKTIFGTTGAWNWEDLIDKILDQPSAATFLPSKLWLEFVGRPASPAELSKLGQIFRTGNWEIEPVVRAILTAPPFWDSASSRLIRSPVELIAATVRGPGASLPAQRIASLLKKLYQPLGNPDSVLGWPVGRQWINADSLLARQSFMAELAKTLKNKPVEAEVVASEAWQFK